MVKIYGNVIISPPKEVNLKQDDANVGNKKKARYLKLDSSTTVTAGSSEVITVQPPQGKRWKIVDLKLLAYAPDGATSGSHKFEVVGIINLYGVSSSYDTNVDIKGSYLTSGSYYYLDRAEVQEMLKRGALYSTYDNPVFINYKNNTDADQTTARYIRLLVLEEDEAA